MRDGTRSQPPYAGSFVLLELLVGAGLWQYREILEKREQSQASQDGGAQPTKLHEILGFFGSNMKAFVGCGMSAPIPNCASPDCHFTAPIGTDYFCKVKLAKASPPIQEVATLQVMGLENAFTTGKTMFLRENLPSLKQSVLDFGGFPENPFQTYKDHR